MTARVHALEADRVLLEQWIAALARQGASKATIGAKLVPVCGFYRWAHQEGMMDRDIGMYVRRPSRPRRSRQEWLTLEQLRTVLAAALEAGPPVSGLAHLLALNGLRLGETIAARVEHLGRIDDVTTLRLPARKGGVMDIVSLPAATVDALEISIGGRERGLLLRTSTGKALTPSGVYAALDNLSEVARLERPLRPHMLRATFVTLSLDAGVPARDIMASTGHASVEMVAYYDRAFAAVQRNASHRLASHVAGHDESAPTGP